MKRGIEEGERVRVREKRGTVSERKVLLRSVRGKRGERAPDKQCEGRETR